jgi:hypothetical protein
MKRGEIYREAARLLECFEISHGCHAIERATNYDVALFYPAIDAFAEYFKPRSCGKTRTWFGEGFNDENRDRRILALCFMAAITEDEERAHG